MAGPIKLYLLTGFLGAGKTTFLQQAMQELAAFKVGILMNEFGNLSIDGIRLRRQGVEVVELNNGSVFCSCLKGAFIDSLVAYSELPIDYLLVEASGMADPSSIETILESVIGKVKGRAYDYQGSICIVDALNFLEQADLLLSIERQVEASGLIVVNKTDLADEETLREVEEKVRSINSWAKIERVQHGKVPPAVWKQTLGKREVYREAESCNTPGNRPVAHTLAITGDFSKALFCEFIQALAPRMLRMKGFFRLDGAWHQIDAVGNQMVVEPMELERDKSELVFISSQGLAALQQIYEQWDARFTVSISLK